MQCLISWYKKKHPDISKYIDNTPQQEESLAALRQLETSVLAPIEHQFGFVSISYGFTSFRLKNYLQRHHPGQMAPSIDQHAASERNEKGNLICKRQGAACDFQVEGYENMMDEVAKFIITQLPFDRLYFYGKDRPIHVSVGPENSRFVQIMKPSDSGHAVPTRRATGTDSLKLFE